VSDTLRVVFDCNIYWRALFSPSGVGSKCIKLVQAGRIFCFLSPEILAEITDVLSRQETLRDFPSITSFKIDAFIKDIRSYSTLVEKVPHVFVLDRDPKDEVYVDLAIAVDANYIVTTDRDLLDLMTGFDDASKEFRQRFRNIKIVRPNEFLKIISETGLSFAP